MAPVRITVEYDQKHPFKVKNLKIKKTSHSEDSNYLGCDVFRLSKIAFLEVFFWFWRQN